MRQGEFVKNFTSSTLRQSFACPNHLHKRLARCFVVVFMARAFFSWFLSLFLTCVGPALAEQATVAGATADYVDDTTRALSVSARTALQQELAAFHAETGVLLAIKADSYLDSGVTLRTAARRARQAVCPSGPVALIMIERGKNGFVISHSPELWQRYPLADLVELLRETQREASIQGSEVEKKLVATSRLWMSHIRALEQARQRGLPMVKSQEKPLLLSFFIALAVLGWGCLHASARAHRRSDLQNQRYPLPEVVVGQRLGAPFGGGRIILWDHEHPTN
jgi:hypothetical protein